MGIYQYVYMYIYHINICGFCEFMQSTRIVDYSTACATCTVYLLYSLKSQYNPGLDVKLLHPVSRFAKVQLHYIDVL